VSIFEQVCHSVALEVNNGRLKVAEMNRDGTHLLGVPLEISFLHTATHRNLLLAKDTDWFCRPTRKLQI
jgi:hypothetical protein